jgi:hypothetical protein
MAIQTLYPAITPSLLLDFANVKALDPRVSFVRTTTAVFYNGVTTAKAEENLLLYSQEFDNAYWILQNTTRTSNTETAPDGTVTAETVTNTTDTGSHIIRSSTTISIVSGLPYTISVFAKKGTNNFVQLTSLGTGNPLGTGRANFDLDSGVVGTVDGGTSSITNVGNGWYRCAYTVTASASGTVSIYFGLLTTSTANRFESYTGLGTETVFLWGAQVEQRSAVTAYTPTTTQPITNYIPVLLTAASGVARFDHNPTTGESLGLLVEEQRTNLVLRSEEFDNAAAWGKLNASITSNTVVAPSGTLTGNALIEDTSAGEHRISQTASATLNASITLSLYVKAQPTGVQRNIRLLIGNNGSISNNVSCVFTNTGGVFTVGTLINSGTGSGAAGSVTSVGNGWYRLTVTGIPDPGVGSGTAELRINLRTESTTSYTGDGYSGLYIWGAQLEAGAFPTSYIPTVAATVTRNADVASMTGTNFSSWYRADEGTIVCGINASSGIGVIYHLGTGSGNRITTEKQTATTGRTLINVNSTTEVFGSLALNSGFFAAAYKTNDFAQVGTTGILATDTSCLIPVVDAFYIGMFSNSAVQLNGTIRKIAYYPIRATNAQLVALTS